MLNVNEIWKPIKEYENLYEVSNLGNIRNTKKKVLKCHSQNSGYLQITLYGGNRKKRKYLIHRLVASAFIENINNAPFVNHINGNKLDNSATNLEWCTNSENIKHARHTGLNLYNKPTLGKKKGKSSKFRGVCFDKSRNVWIAAVRHNNKTWYQKRFNTELEAAMHYNWIIDTMKLTDRPKNIIN